MTDADHDGAHIVNLHMALFFTCLRQIIEDGHLFLALPPLYCIRNKMQNLEYCYNEEELNNSLKKYLNQKVFIQRFKGLGEMNPEQLKLTTMIPEKRKIIQIIISNLEKAQNVINLVMGADVTFRRELIMFDKGYADLENLFEIN
jgi:DNA gyrase subunit B